MAAATNNNKDMASKAAAAVATTSADTNRHNRQEQQQPQEQQDNNGGGLGRLMFCTLGICLFYLVYGLLQEHLFSGGDLGPTFVLVTACMTNTFVACVWSRIQRASAASAADTAKSSDDDGNHETVEEGDYHCLDHRLLALTSLCYVLSMTCSNEAVHIVSYPTAVLAKSCKLVPTVVFGSLRRSHSFHEWFAALTITAGILVFQYTRIQQQQQQLKPQETGDAAADHHHQATTTFGMVLLWTSLLFDGLLASCQDHLKHPPTSTTTTTTPSSSKSKPAVVHKERKMRPPTAVETMLYVNVYAILYLIPLAYLQDQMHLKLLGDHWWSVLAINLSAACGQVFIFLCLTWYSPIVTTTITTTRKFITILISVWAFGHHFTPIQWTSIVIVFTGLYAAIVEQGRQSSHKSMQSSNSEVNKGSKQQ